MDQNNEPNRAVLKSVILHTVSFLAAGTLATIMASKVALAVVDVRLANIESDIGRMGTTLSQLVDLQVYNAGATEWMRSTDKTIQSVIDVQHNLMKQTQDRYPRSEAREDHRRLEQMIKSYQPE